MKPNELRKKIIELSCETGSSHIAPALSCVEIITTIYNNLITKEDKFILSKGHGCLALYAILLDKGYNPDISCGHPDIDVNNGIECTTGSLGHGLPVAVGMALAKKFRKEGGRVYVVMGDSEFQEGTTWESLLIASHHKLNNLTIIVDRNKIQALDYIENVVSIGDLRKKIRTFNCDCIDVMNGNSEDSLLKAMSLKGFKPIVIIAHTTKGKGVSFMENKPEWHARSVDKEQKESACKELEMCK